MSRLLVTLLAALTIIAMPLAGGAAAKTTNIYQLAHQSVSLTADGLFKGGLSRSDSARLHAVFDQLNAELSRIDRSLRPSIERNPHIQRSTSSVVRSGTGGHFASLAASWCGYIHVSLFADGTILGLPAGAVLGAAGIWLGQGVPGQAACGEVRIQHLLLGDIEWSHPQSL